MRKKFSVIWIQEDAFRYECFRNYNSAKAFARQKSIDYQAANLINDSQTMKFRNGWER